MNLLATSRGRKAVFTCLYLSEGAPIGYIWWALPTRLKLAEVPLGDITGLLAFLAMPWAFKFAWAPLVDVLRGGRFQHRAWILAAQLIMGLALLPLFWLDLRADFGWISALFVLHGFAAATQDVAIDTLAIRVTPVPERGAMNGWMQAGMLTGRSLFGPGVLKLEQALGETAVVAALLAAIGFSSLLVLACTRDPGESEPLAPREVLKRFGSALASALKQANTWLGLGLALLGGAAFEAAGAVAGPFLLDHMSALPKEARGAAVGSFYLYAVAAMLAGALLGGYGSDKVGHKRSVTCALLLLTLLVAGLGHGDLARWDADALTALLVAVYFAIGLYTASSYALFMDLTDPRLGATQFSAFMGMTNVCESWSAKSMGMLKPVFGYGGTFLWLALGSLLVLPLIFCMKLGRHDLDEQAGNSGQ
ncbi:MAG: MFS transporter [Planctomycetota bacterium]|nr:MFS transporter [Planctomycetota bacterium]